jgi:hypothetical protein
MTAPFKDGNRSIEEKNPNEFWLCENGYPVIRLKPPNKDGQRSFFEEYVGNRIIVGTVGKIDICNNLIDSYKKYNFPKQRRGESRVYN